MFVGGYLFSRATTPTPPSGWPVCLIAFVLTVVWLQSIAGTQGAVNELTIGNEGEARRRAENLGQPELERPPAAVVAAPTGGAE